MLAAVAPSIRLVMEGFLIVLESKLLSKILAILLEPGCRLLPEAHRAVGDLLNQPGPS